MYNRIKFDPNMNIIHIDNYQHDSRYELYSCGKFIIGLDSEQKMLDYVFSDLCTLSSFVIIRNNKPYLIYNKSEC